MQSTHPTGTHRVCYQCDNHAQSGSMFCIECLPERFPPIIREKPPKPPRRSLWQLVSGILRLRSHSRNLSRRIIGLESDLSDMQQANVALRKRCKDLKVQLSAMTQAFDECDEERSKLARKLTSIAIDWAPVAEIALKHLGSSAEMPAIAAFVLNRIKDHEDYFTAASEAWRIKGFCQDQKEGIKWDGEGSLATFVINLLRQPSAGQNADTAVSEQPAALPAPLGQNPETEIAPGHNPDRLTVAQVGEGFRLLSPEEQSRPREGDSSRELWINSERKWSPGYNGSISGFTYRVRI